MIILYAQNMKWVQHPDDGEPVFYSFISWDKLDRFKGGRLIVHPSLDSVAQRLQLVVISTCWIEESDAQYLCQQKHNSIRPAGIVVLSRGCRVLKIGNLGPEGLP